MDRDTVLELLAAHKDELAARYGVVSLALFGSTARNTAHDSSDVDVLIGFDGPATSNRYFGVQFYLEDLLCRPVDLVTTKALRPEFRQQVEAEALHV
ncbi:MAG TPA: nucleotidyltransferase family protein [Telluria sp.]|nr:nucleotidyltransferase family protein [Telluria sp.]